MIGHAPDKASPLVQLVRGTEKTAGVHAIILRQPVVEKSVLEKLGLTRSDPQAGGRQPGVYVQITRPGEPFMNFRLARRKFHLPLWFYLQVLDFFAPGGQYQKIRLRAQREVANLRQLREPVSLGVVTGFYHHGRIRFLLPFEHVTINEQQQQQKETLYICVIAESKNPEGTEPECWISDTTEKLNHQLETGPFQELAKYARAELLPWIREQGGIFVSTEPAVAAAPSHSSSSAPAAAPAAAAPAAEVQHAVEVVEEVHNASLAIDTLERVCMEVALQLGKPQHLLTQQQNKQPPQQPPPSLPPPQKQQREQQPNKKSDRTSSSSSNPHSGAKSHHQQPTKQQQPQQQQKSQQQQREQQQKPAASSRASASATGGGGVKKRTPNPYYSSESSDSDTPSSSACRGQQQQQQRHQQPLNSAAAAAQKRPQPAGGYFTQDRYKDQPEAKRSRQ
jgi:hypothetical protein